MTSLRTGLHVALLSLFVLPVAVAQSVPFVDPANLRGERVKPRTGLELPIDQGAKGLQQMLLRLRTRASLMMIVAHPDDEDGGMLTYEVRGHGVRAAMLTLNRGEGGQNLMTGDFDDALGLIRTQELLSADRYFGTDQMFGTEIDFGFSKTREEALAQWTHDRVLYDAVRAVRLYRPLVITSVFTGNPTDGHGHHQVAGQMAQEVFDAAADPKVFPDQIQQGLEPWAPLKVYARAPNARVTAEGIYDSATEQYVPVRFYNYVEKKWLDAVPTANIQIHEGEFSDALGMTYVQFARQGLALQKTQIGAGVRVPPAGAFDVAYTRYGSRVPANPQERDFFEGIDTSIAAIATLAPHAPASLRQQLDMLGQRFDVAARMDAAKPANIAPVLADAMRALDGIIESLPSLSIPAIERSDVLHELRIKHVQLNDALVLALGLSVTTELDTTHPNTCRTAVLPSCTAVVNTIVTNGPVGSVRVVSDFTSYTGESKDERTWAPFTAFLAPGERLWPERSTFSMMVPSSGSGPQSLKPDPLALARAQGQPFFSRPNHEQPFYDLTDPTLRLAPQTPPNAFWTRFSYAGVELLLGHVVTTQTKPTDPSIPLRVAPAVRVAIAPSAIVVPRSSDSFHINVSVTNDASAPLNGDVVLHLPTGWSTSSGATTAPLEAAPGGETRSIPFTVVPAATQRGVYTASAEAETLNGRVTGSYRLVGYPGLTPTPLYTPAVVRVTPLDVAIAPHLRVAYIPGTGDEVPELLDNIGIHPTTLKVADLSTANLSVFDVLIIGVRAYTAHKELPDATPGILDFARNGGTVIVQYQAHAYLPSYAPYPITLEGDGTRVVEEDAKVTLTQSDTTLLSAPNRIESADFEGWVEERGHGFPATWDTHYVAPTEVHDAGQPPQRGGLLVAPVGKGFYVYDAFALYRQLPEAVPGAYRLFANMLSLGRK